MSFRAFRSLSFVLAIFVAFPSFSQTDPLAVAGAYVESSAGSLGLTAADVSDRRVSDQYRNQRNGLTHIYYIQHYQGLDVFNAIYSLAVTPAGTVVAPASRFVSRLASKVNTTTPSLTASQAVARAAGHLGMPSTTTAAATPKLLLVPTGNRVRLAWDVTIEGISYVRNFRNDVGAEVDQRGLDAVVRGAEKRGSPEHAPYDLIFINGAVAEIPDMLLDQLAMKGRLVTVLKRPGSPVGCVRRSSPSWR